MSLVKGWRQLVMVSQSNHPCAPALDFSQERGDWLKNQCPANPWPRFSGASPVAGRGGGGHQHFLFILSFIELLVVSIVEPSSDREALKTTPGELARGCFVIHSLSRKPRFIWWRSD